jgi:hypothetical protein
MCLSQQAMQRTVVAEKGPLRVKNWSISINPPVFIPVRVAVTCCSFGRGSSINPMESLRSGAER